MFCGLLFVTLLLVLRCVCRPDLTPVYETLTSGGEDGGRRPSTDTFVTAASTPRRPAGPGGDGPGAAGDAGDGPVIETVSPVVHRSADSEA